MLGEQLTFFERPVNPTSSAMINAYNSVFMRMPRRKYQSQVSSQTGPGQMSSPEPAFLTSGRERPWKARVAEGKPKESRMQARGLPKMVYFRWSTNAGVNIH